MKSRIAVFEGYGVPFRGMGGRPASMGRPSMGRPSMGRPSSTFGRRSYYVPPRNESMTDSARPFRRGYKVKAAPNTPAQKKFKKCARKCSTRRGARSKFPTCMRKCMKTKRRSKR